MTAIGTCLSCRTWNQFFGDVTPFHCFGNGDRPAPEGVMGGFKCGCDCRNWSALKRWKWRRKNGRID